jgi:hypothetical protein
MFRPLLAAFLVCCVTAPCRAQGNLKVEARKQSPPSSLAPEIARSLGGQSYRVQDEQGAPLAEIWVREGTPASEKPAGPKGVIQFPFLADGELLGVLEFQKEGHDYRDQPIPKGLYTMRYGLQPVNGDHLGVSAFRDYILLLPASKDKALAVPARKQLEQRSADAAGTSHPASFLLLMAPEGTKDVPAVHHDAEKETWGVVLPLRLQVKGDGRPLAYPVELIVVGMAAA